MAARLSPNDDAQGLDSPSATESNTTTEV